MIFIDILSLADEVHWDRFFSEYFGFPVSVITEPALCTHICSSIIDAM
jgi:hypothetical protein